KLDEPVGDRATFAHRARTARVGDVAVVQIAAPRRAAFELRHADAVGARGGGGAGAAAAGVVERLLADGAERLVEAAAQAVAQDVPTGAARELADVHLAVGVDDESAEAGAALVLAVVARRLVEVLAVAC